MRAARWIPLLAMLMVCRYAGAQAPAQSFESPDALQKWQITGAVQLDSQRAHSGKRAVMLAPGARAVLNVRPTDGTGRVDLWVFDDGTSPANPKQHAAGPMWGLVQADGHMCTIGAIYAPYLSGNTTYATAAFSPDKQQRPWQEVQYLGIKRTPQWYHWTFDFNPQTGLRILLDGKDLNEQHERFNWNKSRLDGFTGVVLFGDASGSNQSLWIDDVRITLGPPAKSKTRWPPPPPAPPADLTVLPLPAKQAAAPYAAWPNGPGQDPDFFPIAVWLQDPKLAAKYKAAGINLYVGLWRGPTQEQLDLLRRAGMKVICDQNEFALKHLDDPVIVAWMHGDEPDNAHRFDQYWNSDKSRIKDGWPDLYQARRLDTNDYRGYGPPVPPKWIVRDYRRIQANDPSRPILVNLGQGVAWEQYKGRGERTGHLEDYAQYMRGCDIVSYDIYPAAHRDLQVKDALWYVARGVRRLRQWSNDKKIVWNALETGTISIPGATPSPAQVRAEIWMSIIHGSRGLIYFVHQFKPTMNEHALLDNPQMLATVTATNHQIEDLACILNGPTLVDTLTVRSTNPNTPVHAIAKRWGDWIYVFAVAMYQEETVAEFRLDGVASGHAEVIDERRSVDVTDGGFRDKFAANGVHLYRIRVAR